jgi:hypothetical protein
MPLRNRLCENRRRFLAFATAAAVNDRTSPGSIRKMVSSILKYFHIFYTIHRVNYLILYPVSGK